MCFIDEINILLIVKCVEHMWHFFTSLFYFEAYFQKKNWDDKLLGRDLGAFQTFKKFFTYKLW